MGFAQELKASIFQSAVCGKLSVQRESEKAIELKSSVEEEPYDIPENWRWYTLLDVIEDKPKNGYSPQSVSFETNIRNLTLTATTSGYFKPDEYKYIDISLDEAKPYWLKHDDILIQRSNSRELVGTSCIYNGEDDQYVYPDLMMRIHVREEIEVEYVDFVLKSPMVRSYYSSKASGTSKSMPKINQGIVCNTLIPIPPREEQKRIVGKLKQILPLLHDYEKLEEKSSELEKRFLCDLKDSILLAAMEGKLTERLKSDTSPSELVKLMENYYGKKIHGTVEDDVEFSWPEEWLVVKVNEATDLYTGNSIPEAVKAQKYVGLKEGYNYIGTKDVEYDHTIVYENGVKIPFNEPGFKYADKDATLLCIEGGSAGRKIAILDEKVCFGNKLCAFHPIGIDKKFLYYYLQSPVFLSTFRDNISGIIGGVSIGKIKKLYIPVPSIEEQRRIVERLEMLLPLCE